MSSRKKKTKSQSQREKERKELINFRAFRRDHPEFGNRIVSCRRGADPPDFICRDSRNAKIAVELVEWLEQRQTNTSKKQYALEDSYHSVLRDWQSLTPEHVRRRAGDRNRFRCGAKLEKEKCLRNGWGSVSFRL